MKKILLLSAFLGFGVSFVIAQSQIQPTSAPAGRQQAPVTNPKQVIKDEKGKQMKNEEKAVKVEKAEENEKSEKMEKAEKNMRDKAHMHKEEHMSHKNSHEKPHEVKNKFKKDGVHDNRNKEFENGKNKPNTEPAPTEKK
jgi:Skp family chaperone for outer membrane proteins